MTIRYSRWLIGRLVLSLASIVLVGMWINLYTEELAESGFLEGVGRLSWGNTLIVAGVLAFAASELSAQKGHEMASDSFAKKHETLKQRQHQLIKQTLTIVCELVSTTLGVSCNARYFKAVTDPDGSVHLQQDRDLAVLNIRMPREFGFTRIAIGTPHIVNNRSYLERTPLYEELPEDHTSLYDARVARMIDPRQRWVLACPVLTLDPETNRHDEDGSPHGVITFYGVDLPMAQGREQRIEASLHYATQFADHMSHLLNMLDVTRELGDQDDHGESTTS